jgi:sterol desaturase/sphingolipid hydroxylase (fatty acid hydroxylase superfamily)
MTHIILFLAWTLLIYIVHRLAHIIPSIKELHFMHHHYISTHGATGWHWSNLFFYQDDYFSTYEIYITEVIPTFLFCLFTGEWWIFLFFYVWSAFIQENIEHNIKFDMYPFLTSGKWHMVHHNVGEYNFGIFTPIWDILFDTYRKKD